MFERQVASWMSGGMFVLTGILVGDRIGFAGGNSDRAPTASATATRYEPAGPLDGDRFSLEPASGWQGDRTATTWWWQVDFAEPRDVGAILQVQGDHPTVLRNSPQRYVWRWSADGMIWHNLRETEVVAERRMFRLHRLKQPVHARHLRLQIFSATGAAPTLREVEFFDEPTVRVPFDPWIIAVSTFEEATLPGPGQSFIQLAHTCPDWSRAPAQEVWLGDFDESFVAAEPQPVCAFLSGNLAEWCQKMQEPWRGVQEVLANRSLPMWGACGGGQGMAILEEFGVDQPWDCPRCRDARRPLLPIYTHIGHTGITACGDYSKNVFERGACQVRAVAVDPVLSGLPREFSIMESHCGQIEYVPSGWKQIVTRGQGAHTLQQCLRVKDRYIYAAQFHIEMEGTPENSSKLMANFLQLAKEWGGYNPNGKPVPEPASLESEVRPTR